MEILTKPLTETELAKQNEEKIQKMSYEERLAFEKKCKKNFIKIMKKYNRLKK